MMRYPEDSLNFESGIDYASARETKVWRIQRRRKQRKRKTKEGVSVLPLDPADAPTVEAWGRVAKAAGYLKSAQGKKAQA